MKQVSIHNKFLMSPKTIKLLQCNQRGVILIGKIKKLLHNLIVKTNICVIKGCGYFMHFTEEQLQSLLKGKSDKIVVVGGRRAVRDTERNIRKNDGFSPFIIR